VTSDTQPSTYECIDKMSGPRDAITQGCHMSVKSYAGLVQMRWRRRDF